MAFDTTFPYHSNSIVVGVADLRNQTLKGNAIELSGEVKISWEKFLLTGQSKEIKDYFTLPELWSNQVVGGKTISPQGYGTYAFTILLPLGTAASKNELGFGLPHSYSAFQLVVNGEVIASNGVISDNPMFFIPYWKPQAATFIPSSDTLEVLLHLANFSHSKGGMREALQFGDAAIIVYLFNRDLAFDYILTGCLLMGGLFFLGLYLFGRNDSALLLFSLFCILYAYRIIGAKNYGLQHLYPNLDWYFTTKLEYITLYLSASMFLVYSYFLYPEKFKRNVLYVSLALVLAFFLLTLFSKPIFYTGLLNSFFIVLLLTTIYIMYVYIAAYIDKEDGAIFAILSLAALAFSFTYDIIAYFDLVEKNNLVIFISYLGFFFLQSLILSYRFAASFNNVLKKSLEARVAKIDFLSTVSHEIRTPLNAIIGMSNLLKVEPDQKENLSALKLSAQNLLMLINDILDYTKISTGKFEIEEKPTDVILLLNNLLRGFRLKNSQSDAIKIILSIDEATPRYILCDPSRLSQILNNLIGNALKFTDEGHVKISVICLEKNADKTKIKFDVEDTGIGIPEDKHEEIFETFTQINTSTTRPHGGIGLGLSITKKLLVVQGSDISLSSKPGEGTTFTFVQSFPLASTDQIASIDQSRIIEADTLAGSNILVVEDNEMNILVTKKFLQKWKIRFDIAKNGKEALEKFNDHDLILMDLQMPVMDGYQATKELRKMGVHVPIIALTASALLDIREKIFSSGMDDYIIKPFDPDDLYLKLNVHIIKGKEDSK